MGWVYGLGARREMRDYSSGWTKAPRDGHIGKCTYSSPGVIPAARIQAKPEMSASTTAVGGFCVTATWAWWVEVVGADVVRAGVAGAKALPTARAITTSAICVKTAHTTKIAPTKVSTSRGVIFRS